jgi:hypothetical protein
MKRKTFKINQSTLFVYKQHSVKQSYEPTEPTTNMTMTTTGTSGISVTSFLTILEK